MPDLNLALLTQPDIVGHRKPKMSATKPEVETASVNSTRTASVSDAIPTDNPTFSTMPDSKMALLTRPDIGQHRKPETSATEPEVETGSEKPEMEITFERKEVVKRLQRLPPHFRPSLP